jgi:hypothetical protein
MRDKILEIIKEKPKHYSLLIKRNNEMSLWVQENSIIESTHYPEMIYSALHKESNICEFGNRKTIHRISNGWAGCGLANECKCTANAISAGVMKTKGLITDEENIKINLKREKTMIERFGVPFSLQRDSVRKTLSKSKLTSDNEILLNNRNWLYKEYVEDEKSLTEIAKNLNVYYNTIGEYCRKYGFTIRQRTNYSIQEKEICNFLDNLHISYIHGDWSILGSKEIDIYLPEHTLGIEFNGLYWHSYNPYCSHTPKIEDKNRHKNKSDLAKSKGIDLIHVTDYEWKNKSDIIKSIIRSKIGLSTRLYARNLTIKRVPKNIEKDFLNENHLQGYIPSSYAVGLYLDNELYTLMSFGKSRYSNIAEIELLRLCTKINHIVVGGSQKLFKEASKHYQNKTIISYCDMSKFNGNVYKNLGFSQSNKSLPGYYWTDSNLPISRYKCQKSQLQKWLKAFDSSKSESENMFLAGYRRYWDCGQSSWIKSL